MTPKKAREILDSEDVVSMEDIMEAHAVLDKLKKKKKIKDPNASTGIKKLLDIHQ
jgi:hypothetical protein